MGYSRVEIEESLSQAKYDDIFATYLLLGRKSNDVSIRMVENLCSGALINPINWDQGGADS